MQNNYLEPTYVSTNSSFIKIIVQVLLIKYNSSFGRFTHTTITDEILIAMFHPHGLL